jgi:diacylglycerol kinase (ATP)
VDGQERRCSFALVSRVRNYGGDFQIARRTSLFDDRFEVVLFEGAASSRYVKYLAGMLTGRLETMRGVSVLRARSVKLGAGAGRPVPIQVDGELAGQTPATIEIVPDALTILLPPGYAPRGT